MTATFRLLGQIEVRVADQPVDIGHLRQRAVLAVLLIEANRPVSVDQLVDRVWGTGRQPDHPTNALHTYVSLLRRALLPVTNVAIARHSGSYRLTVDEHLIDMHRFRQLVRHAQAADKRDRVFLLEQALHLWQADALASLDTPWINAVRDTLTNERRAAQLDLTDVQLECGHHATLVATLSEQAAANVLDERLAGQLMLALYRSGRQADAVAHYQRIRRHLADELGCDPSAPLRELHQRILAADPALAHASSGKATITAPVPRQLPAAPRMFTGRTRELDVLTAAHTNTDGMVTCAIGGAGGIGKTTLALHWAHHHLDRFPDGQLYVDLHGFDPTGLPSPPSDAVRGFLVGLGVDPAGLPVELDALAALYRSLVAGKRMLIVLDNAHHIDQVLPLLPGGASCTVLVTSRRHLSGLAVLHGARLLDIDILPEPDARDLLARLLGFGRLAAEPEAVVDLLAQCAGLPLAVRIVAARAEHHPEFPLGMLADELRDASARLDGLDAGELRVNLRAVLSWSVRTVTAPAARLFGLLGIAPGPDISLPAATSLVDHSVAEAQVMLRELEHASLVQQHTPGRYRMHDLIRLYATDTAHHDLAQDERDAALRRVVDFYTHTAHTAARLVDPRAEPIQLDPLAPTVHPQPLPDASAALAWLSAEHAALLAAQHTAVRQAWHPTVWQLAQILHPFHIRRGHRRDRLVVWLAALEAATHLADPAARIIVHRNLGDAYADLGRHEEAIGHLHQALALAEEHQDTDRQAHAHHVLALAWERRGDNQQALEHAIHALDLYRAIDEPVWEADALNMVGWCAAQLGEYESARTHCQAALTLHRDRHHPDGEADALDSLGYIAHHTGNHQHAIDYYEQALTLFHALDDAYQSADTLDRLGHAYAALGQHNQADLAWRQALQLYQEQQRDTDIARIQHELNPLDRQPTVQPLPPNQAGNENRSGEDRP